MVCVSRACFFPALASVARPTHQVRTHGAFVSHRLFQPDSTCKGPPGLCDSTGSDSCEGVFTRVAPKNRFSWIHHQLLANNGTHPRSAVRYWIRSTDGCTLQVERSWKGERSRQNGPSTAPATCQVAVEGGNLAQKTPTIAKRKTKRTGRNVRAFTSGTVGRMRVCSVADMWALRRRRFHAAKPSCLQARAFSEAGK